MFSNVLKFLLPVLLVSTSTWANSSKETSFTYAGLYKTLKTSKELEFSQLSLHFLLLDIHQNQRCPTNKVTLGDGEVSQQVLVDEEGALLLPLDKNLKTVHAAISFFTDENVSCYLSMRTSVADFELENINKNNLLSWFNQFENLYETLAGWPGRYFMPGVSGLAIHTTDKRIEVIVNNKKVKELINNSDVLSLTYEELKQLPNNSELKFTHDIVRVLPMLKK